LAFHREYDVFRERSLKKISDQVCVATRFDNEEMISADPAPVTRPTIPLLFQLSVSTRTFALSPIARIVQRQQVVCSVFLFLFE
jgi:hypothetical protein